MLEAPIYYEVIEEMCYPAGYNSEIRTLVVTIKGVSYSITSEVVREAPHMPVNNIDKKHSVANIVIMFNSIKYNVS